MDEFVKDEVFSYGLKEKRLFALKTLFWVVFIVFLVLIYLFYLKTSSNVLVRMINSFFANISFNIGNATVLGMVYASLLGGLFFIMIPMEAVFMTFLAAKHNPVIIIAIFLGGFFVSYTLNYYIGRKLNKISKIIITPKKFYKVKSIINKHGVWAILALNAIPFLPAQPLSTVLGVFKYNKTRFYVFFMLGQLLKYGVISLIFVYIS